MFTNYTIMSHINILNKEDEKKKKKEQIGNLVTSNGKPLMSAVKD